MGAAAQGAGWNLGDDEGTRGIGDIYDRQSRVPVRDGCDAVGISYCLGEAGRVYLGNDDWIHSHKGVKDCDPLQPVGDQNHFLVRKDV